MITPKDMIEAFHMRGNKRTWSNWRRPLQTIDVSIEVLPTDSWAPIQIIHECQFIWKARMNHDEYSIEDVDVREMFAKSMHADFYGDVINMMSELIYVIDRGEKEDADKLARKIHDFLTGKIQ